MSVPLTILFNKSMSEGICPTVWKRSLVTPIFKKGNKSFVNNYRPVCLLNSYSQILEKLIHKRLFSAVKGILASEQHGFFKGRSTTINFLAYTNFIHAIYTDFFKS